jgi:uncharacterized membrane protein HdeD (DUF308 family)
MATQFSRSWWSVLLRGLFAVAFGAVAIGWPKVTFAMLILLIGLYSLFDGILALTTGAKGHWWSELGEGLFGIVLGLAVLIWPGIGAATLIYGIALWAIVRGVFELISAITLRKEIEGEFWLGLAGLLSIGLGVLMAMRPAATAVAVTWVIGFYAIVFGVALVALGFRMKSHGRHLPPAPRAAHPV